MAQEKNKQNIIIILEIKSNLGIKTDGIPIMFAVIYETFLSINGSILLFYHILFISSFELLVMDIYK
tara:strand:- start:99 stop:299 length:201 start_codon:yes stop_codon:yes gene_type:complete